MKKATIIMSVILCLLLTGCNSQTVGNDGQSPNESSTSSATKNVDLAYQNNMHNDAAFFYDNGWIYGQAGGPDGRSYFLKIRSDGTEATNLGQFVIRDPFIIDNYIYFMGVSEHDHGIYKMRTSGESLKKLSDAVGTMQFKDGYIYYTDVAFVDINDITDDTCHLYRCDLDGKNVTDIVKRAVYYPFVFDDFILYQADRDNSSLHICDLNGENDRKLNDCLSYMPLYDGEYIYYVKEETLLDTSSRTIWKMRKDGTEDQQVSKYQVSNGMLLTDEYIYFVYADDSDRLYRINKDGTGITQITQDTDLIYIQFLGNGLKYTKLDASLRGKRFAVAEELGENRQLDSAQAKQLCSTGDINAQFKGKDVFTFKPSHTIVLCTNHMPSVNVIDSGTWDRLIVLPFNGRFRGQANEIKNYGNYLAKNCGGAILQWVIDGAREYIQNDYKLIIPNCISSAIEQYRQENDWLTDFFNEYIALDKNEDTYGNELYEAYTTFCNEHGERTLPMSSVIPMIASKAGVMKKRTKRGNVYCGLRIKDEFERAG